MPTGRLRWRASTWPDAVLIDVEMPGGGLHATQAIHDLSPETVIVILSSDTARSSVLRFLDAGAVAYLRKGTSAQQISVRLTEALDAESSPPGRSISCAGPPMTASARPSTRRAAAWRSCHWRASDAGRMVSVNPAYARMLGREAGEMIGGNAEKWTHPEDLPEGLDDRLAELAAGDSPADRVRGALPAPRWPDRVGRRDGRELLRRERNPVGDRPGPRCV